MPADIVHPARQVAGRASQVIGSGRRSRGIDGSLPGEPGLYRRVAEELAQLADLRLALGRDGDGRIRRRPEERRVGKGSDGTSRFRGAPSHDTQIQHKNEVTQSSTT